MAGGGVIQEEKVSLSCNIPHGMCYCSVVEYSNRNERLLS